LLGGSNQQLTSNLKELFNTITPENDLKWQALKDWNFPLERGVRGVDWLRDAGFDVRGHVLVWPGWQNLPSYLKKHEDSPDKLREEVSNHIREFVTTFKGKLTQWDVVNEPFTNHDLLDILGYEVMVDWFKLARSLDPKPKLYINDFAILSGGGGTTPHRDHYEKMIQLLVDKGAPFDGIGMQGHFGTSLTGPNDLMALLDRYGKFKKDIAVTEFDVEIDDEALAASYVRDFYTVLFSHPAVATIMMWGIWDTQHWHKNAVMYRPDWSLKPGGQAFRDLVWGKWRTQEQGKTDAQGQLRVRGFKGTYDVEVKRGSDSKKVKATLADGGSTLEVKL
jgi:GH35 family endo-1,4-beta-xylanase